MADQQTQVEVEEDPQGSRYVARVGGEVAGFVEYQQTAELVVVTHTEVDPAWEGHGVGGALARGILDGTREKGLRALVVCPFVTAWIGRHPEYADLLYGAPRSTATD